VGCYIWYSEEGTGRAPPAQSSPRCTKCNSPPINGQLPTSYYSMWHYNYLCTVKAAFHYSSQLQTWLQTWFSTRSAARFSTSSCWCATSFRPAFDFICRKPGREPQQFRWFVCVLDKWNVKKTRFKQVRSWLSTCFRPDCVQVFDQVCSWLEYNGMRP